MTPDRWRAITDIFHAALARDATARASFVADACADDGALRAEVEALLAAHDDAGSFGAAPSGEVKRLAPGTQLGPYCLGALIGAGGMGEVYRATDTRLERTVAIKILPSHLRSSPELQARFEREARTISQLTHPNICTLHDIGHESGVDFLVLEHLEGETLAARLTRGALPRDQALRIGIEIASALDHAHRHGVVHRDLKPANVMLTKSGAKLLDFGLAKLRRPSGAFAASVGTVPAANTTAGTLVGTLQYMAPEQIEGQEADTRSDIWALGCVLYELFSGRRAFDGDSFGAVIAAICTARPLPLAQVVRDTPAPVQHVITGCVAKERDDRWQSAADIKRELQWIAGAPAEHASADAAAAQSGRRVGTFPALRIMAMAALCVAAGFLIARFAALPPARTTTPVRLTLSIADQGLTVNLGGLAISPDGRTIVFAATGAGRQRLYARDLSAADVRPLAGTDGADAPFFSPDGQWVGFHAVMRGLLKVPLHGGTSQQISDFGGGPGGAWGDRGQIVFAASVAAKQGPGLWSVKPTGEALRALIETSRDQLVEYATPQVLPGGNAVLYTMRRGGRAAVAALTLPDRRVKTIVDPGSDPRYVASGHLVYIDEGNLKAVGFDPDRLQPQGEPRVVVQNIDDVRDGNGPFVVSETGTLAYVPTVKSRLAWVDRSGTRTPIDLPARTYAYPAISPDGRMFVVTVEEGTRRNLWLGETTGGPLTQLTHGNNDVFGIFTSDAKHVIYTAGDERTYALFWTTTDGATPPTPLRPGARATAVSKDQKVVLFNGGTRTSAVDIFEMRLEKPESARPLVAGPHNEFAATFSRDGKWIAYASNETGRQEVYVAAYPDVARRRQVSTDGGQSPQWNPSSDTELLYQGPDAIMSVDIRAGHVAGTPITLVSHRRQAGMPADWVVSPDGRRFLLIEPMTPTSGSEIDVVLNWFEELRALVPKGAR